MQKYLSVLVDFRPADFQLYFFVAKKRWRGFLEGSWPPQPLSLTPSAKNISISKGPPKFIFNYVIFVSRTILSLTRGHEQRAEQKFPKKLAIGI